MLQIFILKYISIVLKLDWVDMLKVTPIIVLGEGESFDV